MGQRAFDGGYLDATAEVATLQGAFCRTSKVSQIVHQSMFYHQKMTNISRIPIFEYAMSGSLAHWSTYGSQGSTFGPPFGSWY